MGVLFLDLINEHPPTAGIRSKVTHTHTLVNLWFARPLIVFQNAFLNIFTRILSYKLCYRQGGAFSATNSISYFVFDFLNLKKN